MIIASSTIAQEFETATIVTYNLTYYRETTTNCNGNNNDANVKDDALAKIVDFVNSDILVCQEIGSNFTNPSKLIAGALNINGVTKWEQCDYSNNGSNLVNMLFFNSEKFELYEQDYISKDLNGANLVRVIDFYTLYYKDPNLTFGSDTVFITIGAAHLKAGNSSSDEAQRGRATAAVMDYIETNDLKGNLFFVGDLNVYTDNESAFQNLVNHSNASYNFYDPVNALGNWNSNSSYAAYHTQSTRVNSNGCLTGGGMDDRFDHILINEAVKDGNHGVEYINNSFRVVGQDGNRYNQSVIFPQNFSVPKGIDTALFNLSDHLPVRVDITMDKIPVGVREGEILNKNIMVTNPIDDKITIHINNVITLKNAKIEVIDLTGKRIYEQAFETLNNLQTFALQNQPVGTYILRISEHQKPIHIQKIVKK